MESTPVVSDAEIFAELEKSALKYGAAPEAARRIDPRILSELSILESEIGEFGWGPQPGDEEIHWEFIESVEKNESAKKSVGKTVYKPFLAIKATLKNKHGKGNTSTTLIDESNKDYWVCRCSREWLQFKSRKANPVVDALSFEHWPFIDELTKKNLEGAGIPNIAKLAGLSDGDLEKITWIPDLADLRLKARGYVKFVQETKSETVAKKGSK